MLYFIILFILFLLTYHYDYRKNVKHKKAWMIVMLVVFILVAGLRYRLGTDSIRYEKYFIEGTDILNLSENDFKDTRFSPFFILLSAFIRTFTNEFVIFQLIHSTVVNIIISYFFYKNAKSYFLSLILFGLFLYFNLLTEVLREALAVCVFLLAWPFFRDGKWLYWYLMSFFAIMFHTSAVMMFVLPICVLPGINQLFVFGKRTILICCVLGVAALAVQAVFFKYIEALALMENISERASVYSKSDLSSSNLNFVGVSFHVIRLVVYPLLALYFLKKDGVKSIINNKKNQRFDTMVLLSVYVGVVSIIIAIFARFNNYFLFFVMVAISNVAYQPLKIGLRRISYNFGIWIVFLLPLLGLRLYAFQAPMNKSGSLKVYMVYYPYSSRLDMTKDYDREQVFKYNRTH